ncbi:MAG: DNA repair protein RadC [Hyphomicrobiaceae bacterium]
MDDEHHATAFPSMTIADAAPVAARRAVPRGAALSWERPRERLMRHGPGALSDGELLAILIGTGPVGGGGAIAVAESLLVRHGGLAGVFSRAVGELLSAGGIGAARGAALVAVAEISRRLQARPLARGRALRSSGDVHSHFGPLLADEKRELFTAVLVDTKNRVLTAVRISEGSLNASLVHPREAFRPAIREAAAAVVFVHNHPSGDPTPSTEDRRITQRLRSAGELLGIAVLDHIIVARDEYFSFADSGW